MRALTAILTIIFALITTTGGHAFAQSVQIGTVDVTRALNEVAEGQAAQARLDAMFQGKQAELEQFEADLMAQKQEYDAKVAVLSDAARQEYEQKLYQGQMTYQQTAMGFEQQLQETKGELKHMKSLTNCANVLCTDEKECGRSHSRKPENKGPCSYFMAGYCRHENRCTFVHDTEARNKEWAARQPGLVLG